MISICGFLFLFRNDNKIVSLLQSCVKVFGNILFKEVLNGFFGENFVKLNVDGVLMAILIVLILVV